MNKAYKIKLYPNNKQKELIDKTIGCSRFIYNKMLNEKIEIYGQFKELKISKEELYNYKYKTEKEYKKEFEFLKEASSRALQQSRQDLNSAFQNFYKGLKKKSKVGFPKFKSKHNVKWGYREPQVANQIRIKDNKINLLKIGFINFRGLSKNFNGIIKSVTIIKNRDFTYEASILVECKQIIKPRVSNNKIGCDLGLKEFLVCSNGYSFKGIKTELFEIEKLIKKQSKHLSRKKRGSKNYELCRIKLAKIYKYKTNFQNNYFWHLSNKLCSENQTIILEDLHVKGMIKNRKLSHSIFYSGWSKFKIILEQKAFEYNTEIKYVDRFFPSSKLCSSCGGLKDKLSLSERDYICECGLSLDRDLNAAINILNFHSPEYGENRCGEIIRPIEYNSNGSFYEASREIIERNIFL